jgi:hypothetical protein
MVEALALVAAPLGHVFTVSIQSAALSNRTQPETTSDADDDAKRREK